MATPYLQVRLEQATSTQDVARERLGDLPVLVLTPVQTEGRGRLGASWETAPRALAASLALRQPVSDKRPFSLMAGVAALRAVPDVSLKWPNDVMLGERKAGGILVERSEDELLIGLGLNLWWPSNPEGMVALYEDDPGPERHAEIGALWGAELMRLLHDPGWPLDEYRAGCDTLGRQVTWEPDGSGLAVDVAKDGGLVVELDGAGQTILRSGTVRHVRAI